MCGIAGYAGPKRAAPILVRMLKLLEYRGYDSVGVATMDRKGTIRVSKGVGPIDKVLAEKRLDALPGNVGIGHTRRSTHGRVSEVNAHPHVDCSGTIALVHNGVIQNYLEVKRRLEDLGHEFRSETDTEVVAHLIEEYVGRGLDTLEALRKALEELEGNFSIALIRSGEERVYVMKKGLLPLIIGLSSGEVFVASDVIALLPYTRRVIYLEDGQYGYAGPGGYAIFRDGKPEIAEIKEVDMDPARVDKGGFAHRMHKEIYDIPHFASMFASYAEHHAGPARELVEAYDRIRIIGAGTSYHASLYGEIVLSKSYPRKTFKAVVASEFPNRLDVVSEDDLVIAVSQSGETYDVLEPARILKERGAKILAVVNRRHSELDRVADERLYIEAGLERAVAATKTFVNQMLAFAALAGLPISEIPRRLDNILKRKFKRRDREGRLDEIARLIAEELKTREHAFYLGRHFGYVVAKEGALKIKEVSYIHAEAYPAGELKHGPLALIEDGFPVILVSLSPGLYKKDLSTYEEVVSRGAKAYVFALEGLEFGEDVVRLPEAEEYAAAIFASVPMFLIAYHASVLRGYDPDKPRNLAKSVTVE